MQHHVLLGVHTDRWCIRRCAQGAARFRSVELLIMSQQPFKILTVIWDAWMHEPSASSCKSLSGSEALICVGDGGVSCFELLQGACQAWKLMVLPPYPMLHVALHKSPISVQSMPSSPKPTPGLTSTIRRSQQAPAQMNKECINIRQHTTAGSSPVQPPQ
jgi:hypothetical protein